ncbi:U3 small nucleolar RNA-associated protein 14 B [Bulinus truncatus]|nr:U3 small nucleolar RNA-associated protein 14 B [Bulinus truncatus]
MKRQCTRSSKTIAHLMQELKDTKKLCDEAYKLLHAYKELHFLHRRAEPTVTADIMTGRGRSLRRKQEVSELQPPGIPKNVALRSSDISNNLDMAIHASKDGLKIQAGNLKLKRKHASVTLKRPLNSLDTEKAKQKIARETVLTEMDKWQPVVNEIRSASQTVFSNRPRGLQMFQAMQPKSFTPRTPLELEIYAALGKDECLVKPNQLLTAAETKALKAMTIKEAKARRAELMKHHELLSKMEMKYKRQKKIKSKRYRKFFQKERVATEKKELEHLQKNDPEAFMQKMELMEKNRMELEVDQKKVFALGPCRKAAKKEAALKMLILMGELTPSQGNCSAD